MSSDLKKKKEALEKDPSVNYAYGISDSINPYLEITLLFLRREYGILEDTYPHIFIVGADKDKLQSVVNPKFKFQFDNEGEAKNREEELTKQGLSAHMFESMAVPEDFKKYLKILQKRKIAGDDIE